MKNCKRCGKEFDAGYYHNGKASWRVTCYGCLPKVEPKNPIKKCKVCDKDFEPGRYADGRRSDRKICSDCFSREPGIYGTSTGANRYNIDNLRLACQESSSIAQVLIKLNLKPAGGNYQTINKYIKILEIDISHFTGQGSNKGKPNTNRRKLSLDDILQDTGSYYSSDKLRKRLIESGTLEAKCNKCGLSEWINAPIPLELHHKNGIHTDNRLENLEILCPNCHATTENYRGQKKKKS